MGFLKVETCSHAMPSEVDLSEELLWLREDKLVRFFIQKKQFMVVCDNIVEVQSVRKELS